MVVDFPESYHRRVFFLHQVYRHCVESIVAVLRSGGGCDVIACLVGREHIASALVVGSRRIDAHGRESGAGSRIGIKRERKLLERVVSGGNIGVGQFVGIVESEGSRARYLHTHFLLVGIVFHDVFLAVKVIETSGNGLVIVDRAHEAVARKALRAGIAIIGVVGILAAQILESEQAVEVGKSIGDEEAEFSAAYHEVIGGRLPAE